MGEFCASYGQAISKEKSVTYVCKGFSLREARSLSNVVGFKLETELGHYLGVPLFHKKVLKDTYQRVVDRVMKRFVIMAYQKPITGRKSYFDSNCPKCFTDIYYANVPNSIRNGQ